MLGIFAKSFNTATRTDTRGIGAHPVIGARARPLTAVGPPNWSPIRKAGGATEIRGPSRHHGRFEPGSPRAARVAFF
jgi:hypothetical protein